MSSKCWLEMFELWDMYGKLFELSDNPGTCTNTCTDIKQPEQNSVATI